MENIDTFEEFLKKKTDSKSVSKDDWNKRKDAWLNSITNLYADIKKWLKKSVNQDLIQIKEK